MNFTERFQKAIQIDTSWNDKTSDVCEANLKKFQDFLAESYPAFHKAAERRAASPYSVVYKWPAKTKTGEKPVLLLAHYDVVPAEKAKWTADPFGAEIRKVDDDEFIYGRGTLDMKSILMAILEGAEALCAQGFAPSRDVWFAFGGDEERTGVIGAKTLAEEIARDGCFGEKPHFAWILDEGSPVAIDQIKGVASPLALVGIEEKGFVSLDLTVEQKPGHASQPPKVQAVAVLARALSRIDKKPFPNRLIPTTKAFFAGLGPQAGGVTGWAMKNAGLLGPLFFKLAAATPATAAMLHTTVAMTQLEGSAADNVMPSAARAVLNLRLLPPWTTESAIARIKKIIDDERVAVTVHGYASDPIPAAPGQEKMEGGGWKEIIAASESAFPGVPMLPFLMVATTDSRHYAPLADGIFRFSPQKLNPRELSLIHGHDERISLSNLENCRRFYAALLEIL